MPERTPTQAEIDATIVRTLAEAKKFDAETAAATATAALQAALARKEVAAAEAAETSLISTREKEASRILSDEHMHVYQFDGAVNDVSAKTCMAKLREWDRADPECPMEVILNSPGGAVIPGMALFDLLTRFSLRGGGKHNMTIGAQGYAASMGGILLQAGDTRWIGAQSYLLIHEISASTGGKIGEMKDDVKFYESINARIVALFVERAGGKITKRKFVDSWTRIDWWLLSDESLKLGFVDEIR